MTSTTLPARVLQIFGSALLPLCAAGLALGLGLAVTGRDDLATIAWVVPSGIVGIRLAWSILRDLLAGEAGVDVIAVLAIGGALAMEEALAAAVIALMLATGEALERYAEGRAHRELTALLSRAPRDVHRYEDGELVTRPIDAVVIGDRLMVKPGEVVPVDGLVEGAAAVLDEAALTGEARPVTRAEGDQVNSGTLNAGGPFDLRAIAIAEQSTYAGIVRLVREAEGSKAPFVRLADRYALLFVPLTLAVASFAWLDLGRSRPGAGRDRRRDALSTAPCRADRDRGGPQSSGPTRDHREGWRTIGNARPGPSAPLRQDGHAHRRATAPGRGRGGARCRPE